MLIKKIIYIFDMPMKKIKYIFDISCASLKGSRTLRIKAPRGFYASMCLTSQITMSLRHSFSFILQFIELIMS